MPYASQEQNTGKGEQPVGKTGLRQHSHEHTRMGCAVSCTSLMFEESHGTSPLRNRYGLHTYAHHSKTATGKWIVPRSAAEIALPKTQILKPRALH